MKTAKRGAAAQCRTMRGMSPGQQVVWATMLGGIFTVAAVQVAGIVLG